MEANRKKMKIGVEVSTWSRLYGRSETKKETSESRMEVILHARTHVATGIQRRRSLERAGVPPEDEMCTHESTWSRGYNADVHTNGQVVRPEDDMRGPRIGKNKER